MDYVLVCKHDSSKLHMKKKKEKNSSLKIIKTQSLLFFPPLVTQDLLHLRNVLKSEWHIIYAALVQFPYLSSFIPALYLHMNFVISKVHLFDLCKIPKLS